MSLWKQLASRFRWKGNRNVAACLEVLPVLRLQVQEVAEQVEKAVVAVCGNFAGMAERSRRAVDKASELLGAGEETGTTSVEQSIETSRSTITSLLDRLERAGNVSAMVVSRMEQVEKSVGGIEGLLSELQKIAFSNKLVALNAKIEAVHVGEMGRGFEVVADEISRQGDQSNELAEGIGQRVREMRDRINSAAVDLLVVVAENRKTLSASRAEAEKALNVLCSIHQRSEESMATMVAENTALAGQISDAIVGLQFQDRTCQRLSHVAEVLETVERQLGNRAGPDKVSSSAQEPRKQLIDHMRDGYTMESERAIHTRMMSGSLPDADEGDDIELF